MSASREEVLSYALDVISEWIQGYTCPSDEKRFRIALTVTEVP